MKFPGAYSANDKGITVQSKWLLHQLSFNINWIFGSRREETDFATSVYNAAGKPYPDNGYAIPGPAVWTG